MLLLEISLGLKSSRDSRVTLLVVNVDYSWVNVDYGGSMLIIVVMLTMVPLRSRVGFA